MGTATTDALGNFVKQFTIPSSAASGAHQVILSGTNTSGVAASTTLALTLGSLPVTGTSTTLPLLIIGITLVLAGMAMNVRKKRIHI